MHAEPTTLGLTVDGVTPTASLNGSIDLPALDVQPRRRTPDGAGVLFYAPPLGTLLLCVLWLVGRALWRWLA